MQLHVRFKAKKCEVRSFRSSLSDESLIHSDTWHGFERHYDGGRLLFATFIESRISILHSI